MNTLRFRNDSLILIGFGYTPFASYHFAALEDSFLYTWTPGDLVCINVADPESIFIYRTYSPIGGTSGLVALDGDAYLGNAYTFCDDSPPRAWPRVGVAKIDMVNSATPVNTFGGYSRENRFFGDLACNGEYVFHVNSEMSDGPAWTIGGSDLFVLGTDTSYSFDSRWDGQGVFSVDVIGENLLAVGFEYGVSVLNISNLDSIYESAFYIDTLGAMDITHFAIKEDRLYAMGHPRDGFATLYMFKLDDSVISGIEEDFPPQTALPVAFEISAYPNPFNSAVTIAVDIPVGDGSPVPISVEIYDVNGRRVSVIGNYDQPVIARRASPDEAISYGCEKDCFGQSPRNDNAGEFTWTPAPSLPSGVYLVRRSRGPRPRRPFDRLRGRSDEAGRVSQIVQIHLLFRCTKQSPTLNSTLSPLHSHRPFVG